MADLISREALIEWFTHKENEFAEKHPTGMRLKFAEGIARALANIPAVDAVPLSEVYRLIAGHSNYHGDNILAALTCVTEGKEVKPIRPIAPAVDALEIGSCDGCIYSHRKRPQKCSCCRRNMDLKDCFERREENG